VEQKFYARDQGLMIKYHGEKSKLAEVEWPLQSPFITLIKEKQNVGYFKDQ